MNDSTPITPWRALFWEPVSGTGERIMVGVIHAFNNKWRAERVIRDDVLDSLYGKASADVKSLLEHAFTLYETVASVSNDINSLAFQASGIFPGPARETEANTPAELLHTAALLYSSLAQIDQFDEQEENDLPQSEEVVKQFATAVKESVASMDATLIAGFGQGGRLIPGGKLVRFGYFTPALILHFSVLHPVRQSASVRDARAKLWELSRASTLAGIKNTALITSIPRPDDPAIGLMQQKHIRSNHHEIEREADNAHIRLYPVHNAQQAAEKLIELA